MNAVQDPKGLIHERIDAERRVLYDFAVKLVEAADLKAQIEDLYKPGWKGIELIVFDSDQYCALHLIKSDDSNFSVDYFRSLYPEHRLDDIMKNAGFINTLETITENTGFHGKLTKFFGSFAFCMSNKITHENYQDFAKILGHIHKTINYYNNKK